MVCSTVYEISEDVYQCFINYSTIDGRKKSDAVGFIPGRYLKIISDGEKVLRYIIYYAALFWAIHPGEEMYAGNIKGYVCYFVFIHLQYIDAGNIYDERYFLRVLRPCS